VRVSAFSGLEYWNGALEWTPYWTGVLEGNTADFTLHFVYDLCVCNFQYEWSMTILLKRQEKLC
jgi:hypothetical protein